VSIKAVTPVAAAANPAHPDHARWVKEQTLAREASHHATFRAAETANIVALERLANRKQRPKKPKAPRKDITPEQLAKAGVTKKIATARKLPPKSPCNMCRKCIDCKRQLRMSQIANKAKQNDSKAFILAMEFSAIILAVTQRKDYKDGLGRELPFSRIAGEDAARAAITGFEWACDRSTSFMGQWR
jgi:hypothetical protein